MHKAEVTNYSRCLNIYTNGFYCLYHEWYSKATYCDATRHHHMRHRLADLRQVPDASPHRPIPVPIVYLLAFFRNPCLSAVIYQDGPRCKWGDGMRCREPARRGLRWQCRAHGGCGMREGMEASPREQYFALRNRGGSQGRQFR